MSLHELNKLDQRLANNPEKMPVLFLGHGSPMNGIEDNVYSQSWRKLGAEIPEPKAVLVISAHWLTKGTHVTAMDFPRTIHDFGGFPQALFNVNYPAPGSPEVAKQTANLVSDLEIGLDHEWGLDHGTWTVVRHMYPEANIPVLQLSIDYHKPLRYHYDLARQLVSLRNKGVLIIGSGNMVHNLRMVDFRRVNEPFGFDWAIEMNELFKKKISEHNHADLIDYQSLHPASKYAIPTPDHYIPLLYTLGLQDENDPVRIFNDQALAGSLTMTSVQFG